MKIAVSSGSDAGLDSPVDPRFGRCAFFTIIEVTDGEVTSVQSLPNTAVSAFHGAGIQSTQMVVNSGVNTIITGNLGPNAFYGLQQAGIPVYSAMPGILVSQALEMFLQGKLQMITQPGAPHMGMGRGRGMGRGMGQGPGRRGPGGGTGPGQNW